MIIHLPEDQELFIRAAVRDGRFASEEHAVSEAIRLLQQREEKLTGPAGTGPANPGNQTAWQRVLEIMEDVPDSVFDGIPPDSSAQLDHYIYGTPKRPTP
jgi:hypothetical protein